MHLARTRRECDVDDPSLEFDQQVVSQLAIAEPRVQTCHGEATVKNLFQLGEIVAVVQNIPRAFAVVPRTPIALTHPANLHRNVDFANSPSAPWRR